MERNCHSKQSLVLFHASDICDYYNFDYNTSTQEDNNQTEIQPKLDSKAFIKILLCTNVMNLQILTSTLSFLPAFLHCYKMYSSKRKSIKIPRTFCFSFSQILLIPMSVHYNSCSSPNIKR